jgi:hypothetical protein
MMDMPLDENVQNEYQTLFNESTIDHYVVKSKHSDGPAFDNKDIAKHWRRNF